MTEVVLFHVLAATAGAAFGLLAIWAGLGRLHWVIRFVPIVAVIVALFPVPAFDLALVFVSQALVVAVPLILVRRFTAPPTDGTATVTPPASHPWRRFSVADLLRATLLIAAVFGVVAYVPENVRASWWKYVLLGTGFGMATLAGAWAARAHRPWWIRLAVVCFVAPLAGVPTALDWRTYFYFRESAWPWCAVTATVGVLVVVWLLLARAAGLTVLRRTGQGSAEDAATARRVGAFRRLVAGVMVGLTSLVILLLPAAAYHDMLHAPLIPTCRPPEPNAYDDLPQIAAALRKLSDQDRRMLFDELHTALQRPGTTPFRPESDSYYVPPFQMLRQLSRDLLAEGDRHRLAGNMIDAQRRYLDLMELGPASSRGGTFVERMIGRTFENMGIEGLRQLRDSLSSDQRGALIVALQAHETDWEPAADVYARELVMTVRMAGSPARISFVNGLSATRAIIEQGDDRRLAMLRLLTCELALAQYAADHGEPPSQLTGLVPDYLPDVPNDPFSGQPLVYRTEPPGYVLYSVGQNCLDDGGRRGASFRFDPDQFLDPVPPPASDGAGED
jgi:hypothetical protein